MIWVKIMDIDSIIKKNKEKRLSYVDVKTPQKSTNSSKLKNLISRILITIILVLSSIIFINSNPQNKELYQKYVFDNTLSFTKIKDLYQKFFGSVDFLKKSEDTTVFKAINYSNIENYKNSNKLTVKEQEIINVITSGIVVFNGDKDDLGNTIIIQGNDGVDIWYSNITDSDISLYDYVESGSVLGISNSDYIYLTIIKDNNYLTYEEYQKLI